MVARKRSNSSWTCGTRKRKLRFPLLLPAFQSTMPEFSNAKLRFVYVPELRTSFPRDLARTSSESLPSLQQDQNKVTRLPGSDRGLRFPDRQNHVCPGPEYSNR